MRERSKGRLPAGNRIRSVTRESRLRETATLGRTRSPGQLGPWGWISRHPQTPLTVSVIVAVHNQGSALTQCLESLQALSPASKEIIVVVYGESDASTRLAEHLGLKVVRAVPQRGLAGARNLGANLAEGDLLLFVDADVTVRSNAVRELREIFQADPQTAAVIGSYDDDSAAGNFLSQYKNLFEHYRHQQAYWDADTFWGACGAIRREVFEEIGGFDESCACAYTADLELGYRLRAAGYRIHLCKDLQVKHLKRWDVWSLVRGDFWGRAVLGTELLRAGRFADHLTLTGTSCAKVVLFYYLLALTALLSLWPQGGLWALLVGALLLLLDVPLLRFFSQKRGLAFALRTIPWHWFFYGSSGLAFAIGVGRHLFSRDQSPMDRPVGFPFQPASDLHSRMQQDRTAKGRQTGQEQDPIDDF